MWPFHPVICDERQLLYELLFVPNYEGLTFRAGKRLMKNLVSDGKTVVDNYRQKLGQLRDKFLGEVIVTVEINVFRILAEMKEVNENIQGIGEYHVLKHS
jgi:hypothetical protein